MEKIGRNDPCPCASGKKYKKCCMESDRQRDTKDEDFSIDEFESPNPFMERDSLDHGFHTSDFKGKIALLKDCLAAPPEDDGMLLEWYLDVADSAESEADLILFDECVKLFSVSLPKLYSDCIPYILNKRLKVALKFGDLNSVSKLFQDIVRITPPDFDLILERADQLAYLGHHNPLLEGFRCGWPCIKNCAELAESEIEEYAGR